MKRLKSHLEMAELISSALKGELSLDDSERLQHWIDESEENKILWKKLTNADYLQGQIKDWDKYDVDHHWKRLQKEVFPQESRWRLISRESAKYAAILLAFLCIASVTVWFFLDRENKGTIQNIVASEDVHIIPKGKVAQLILGNGRVVNLNDSLSQTITEGDGSKVKNQGGVLKYDVANRGGNKREVLYNTLHIPRGGEYKVTLSDGTNVWLNAASSLRYPTQFGGDERKVYLSGEAYFEVAKDEAHPFIVEAGGTDIKVLGTRFNVSAYSDDTREKIALAEGSVKIEQVQGTKSATLVPGYGATIEGDAIHVAKVNVQAALGWKNGMFIFDGESLGSIMKKMSRWYDVDVKYDSGVDTLFHFTGRIKRYENITELLHLIELTGKVKFTVRAHDVEVVPL